MRRPTEPGAPPAVGAKPRRVATRTCVVCRTVSDKRTLVRVHRLADGTLALDPTGKGPGRGAYLCRRRTCWLDAGLGRRLAHALRIVPGAVDAAALQALADMHAEED